MTRLIMFILMFLLIGAFWIVNNNNIHLSQGESRMELGQLYYNWLGNIFSNVKDVTGYVVKMEWLPNNSSLTAE